MSLQLTNDVSAFSASATLFDFLSQIPKMQTWELNKKFG